MRASVFLLCLLSPIVSRAQKDKSNAENNFGWRGEYRHVHREPAKLMNEKKYEKVAEWCTKALKEHPGDVQTMWFLALAKTHLKQDMPDAVAKAIHANVIPPSWMPAELQSRFSGISHGPMLGNIRHNAASFWVRTTNAKVTFRINVFATGDSKTPVAKGEATSTTAADRTAIATVNGLRPNTEYYYEVAIGGTRVLPRPGRYRFRTAPAIGRGGQFTIAFGGGAAFNPKYTKMWRTIPKFRPLAFLFLGDNVYIDAPQDRAYQRYKYYRRQSQPDFRKLASETAIYSIWDDHDFGKNDCWGGLDKNKPSWKRPVLDVFRQNWVNPAYGGGKENPGCWYDFHIGDVHFLMLDGRYYRTPKRIAGENVPTMLGPVQKAWLKKTLSQSKAKFKVICSPVPFVGGNKDKWNGFPEERNELFSFLEKNSIEGVLLMSADRHRGDLLVSRRPKSYDLWEFMTSKLTNVHTHGTIDAKQGAVFSYNKKNVFGLVTFNTASGIPTATYQIMTIDGECVRTFSVTNTMLRARR